MAQFCTTCSADMSSGKYGKRALDAAQKWAPPGRPVDECPGCGERASRATEPEPTNG